MKNVKKLLALLLAMAMLFALCACSNDDKKKEEISNDDLNGEWTLTFIPSAMGLDKQFPFEGFTPTGSITTKAVIKDGTMELYNDGIATWATKMAGDLYDWIYEGDNVYAFMASVNNMTIDEYKAECALADITKDVLLSELAKQITKESLVESVLDGLGDEETLTHDFEIEDGKLHFDEGAVWTITVYKDKIVVNEIKSEESTLTLKDGDMVFNK